MKDTLKLLIVYTMMYVFWGYISITAGKIDPEHKYLHWIAIGAVAVMSLIPIGIYNVLGSIHALTETKELSELPKYLIIAVVMFGFWTWFTWGTTTNENWMVLHWIAVGILSFTSLFPLAVYNILGHLIGYDD